MYSCYTSYMSNKRICNKDGFKIPVCNRIYVWNGYSEWYRDLAPTDQMIQWLHDQSKITSRVKEIFTKHYIAKLNSLKAEGILQKYVDDINKRLQYDDVFLLCYEKPKEFCHRHILAKFLNENFDLDIQEY